MTTSLPNYTQGPPNKPPGDRHLAAVPDEPEPYRQFIHTQNSEVLCNCPIPWPISRLGDCPDCGFQGPEHAEAKARHGVQVINGTAISAADEEDVHGVHLVKKKYQEVNWDEAFAAEPGKVEWLVEPVIEAGTLNSLFAKPGTGKSLLALVDLAMRTTGHVVYVDDENRLVEDNVVRLKSAGYSAADMKKLHMYSFQGLPPLDTKQGGQDLLDLAVEHDARLVIIDTTSRFIDGDENDSGTFLRLYNYTLKPLKALGIAVLRLDHPGRDESRGQRGSSAKEGDVDVIWQLTRDTDGDKLFTLTCRKSRSGNVRYGSTISLTKHFAPLRFEYGSIKEGAAAATTDDPVDEYVQLLDELGVDPGLGRNKAADQLRESKLRTTIDNNKVMAAQTIRRNRPAAA